MPHIFGPVPSRRLGRSLGIDTIPFKTCSYDCIYCQIGSTSHKTIDRQAYIDPEVILGELEEKLKLNPDYITLSGSGEPTLYSRLGELIEGIKKRTDVPVAVLTNGSLLWDQDVRDDLRFADLVVPSLDAVDAESFAKVNRPHPDISFKKMLDGLIAFRNGYRGQIWLEVFVCKGIDLDRELLKKYIILIQPDKIQINTVTRPPAEQFAQRVSRDELEAIANLFDPPGEVIAEFKRSTQSTDSDLCVQSVMEMLRRRPCTLDDTANGLNIHRNEAIKYLDALLQRKSIRIEIINGEQYYLPINQG